MVDVKNILGLFNFSKRYYSLSVLLKEDQEPEVFGLKMITHNDGEFFAEESFGPITINEFLTFNSNYPVLINFEGNAIVSKNTRFEEGYLQSLLFRTNIEELYIYETVVNRQVYVSYTRKNILDPILETFLKADFQVIRFALGPFTTTTILPFLSEDTIALQTSDYTLDIESNHLVSYLKAPSTQSETIHLLNEPFNTLHLTSLSLFIAEKSNHPIIEGASKKLAVNKEESFYKNIFKKAGPIALAFILVFIVIGHFLKQAKTKTFQEKQNEISLLQQTKTTINKLEEEKNNKEYILEKSGFNKNAFFAKYASDITNTVPNKIILDVLNLQPLEQKIKPYEKVKISFNTIKIEGVTVTDLDLDKWIDDLKKIEWVKRLEIINYYKDLAGNGSFELLLEIK